jgi:hypothetical protein
MVSFDRDFDLSLVFLQIVTDFQALNPYQQTEFLQLIQDEYADVLYGEDLIDEFDQCEQRLIQQLVVLFYNYPESQKLSTIIERFVHQFPPEQHEWVLLFGNTIQQYMNDIMNV